MGNKKKLMGVYLPLFLIERRTKFIHVQNYNRTFEDKSWHSETWAQINGKLSFPMIVVVTARPHVIQKTVERENKNKLAFKIGTIEQVKENIWGVLR